MRMFIVALSLFTVAAVTAMQANAAEPDSVVQRVGVGVEESVAVEVDKEKHMTLAQAAQAARRFTRKLGRKTVFAIFATAALFTIEAGSLAVGYERGPLYGLLRRLLWDDAHEGYIYVNARDDFYEYEAHEVLATKKEPDGLQFAAHARTAGSVWIPAGLSSLAIFSIATMLFIFWNLKNPRKAGQKGRFISIPK